MGVVVVAVGDVLAGVVGFAAVGDVVVCVAAG